MIPDPAKFEAKVRAEWMDEATAAAWRKWHNQSVRFWQEKPIPTHDLHCLHFRW